MSAGDTTHVTIGEVSLAIMRLGPPGEAPLVLLHGLGASSTLDLRPTAHHARLAVRERILIDLPGFGRSIAPPDWPATIEAHAEVVMAALDQLGVDTFEIFGHSMGGDVGILVATSALDRVRRLIIAEPLLDPADASLSAHIARQGEASFVRRGHRALLMTTRRQAARGDAAAAGVLPSFELADPVMMHRSAVSLLQERRPGFGDLLKALPMPRTFIAGDRSAIDAGSLSSYGIAVRVIANAGHAMMHEQLDAFVAAIAGDDA